MAVLGDAHVIAGPVALDRVVGVEDGVARHSLLAVEPDVRGLRVAGGPALDLGGDLALHHLDERLRHDDLLGGVYGVRRAGGGG